MILLASGSEWRCLHTPNIPGLCATFQLDLFKLRSIEPAFIYLEQNSASLMRDHCLQSLHACNVYSCCGRESLSDRERERPALLPSPMLEAFCTFIGHLKWSESGHVICCANGMRFLGESCLKMLNSLHDLNKQP